MKEDKIVEIKEQGISVNCGMGKLAGNLVHGYTEPDGTKVTVPEETVAIIITEFHGDHDTDWIAFFDNGFELGRTPLEGGARDIIWKRGIA